ncbi:MAG: hypothetical protein V1701_03005 [Planctomycetota bacterium]
MAITFKSFDEYIKDATSTAKAKINNLVSADNVQNMINNMVSAKMSAGIPRLQAESEAKDDVARTLANDIVDIAQEPASAIPAWAIIAGIGGVAAIGAIVYFRTRNK